MVRKNLEELMATIDVLDSKGVLPTEITGIHYHSQMVQGGNLFVAIPGELVDGHKYIPDAIKNGASVVVCSKFTEDNIPQIKVENPRRALALLSSGFFNFPSKNFPLVGITATNGKTSTSFMLNHILEENGLKTGLIGTVKVKYPDYEKASILTTPQSYDLQEHFFNMDQKEIDACIMEVSSSAQELDRVVGCDFDLVSFHNLSREHIDQHGSFENYYKQKKKLITQAKEDSFVLLNQDEPLIAKLEEETQGKVLHLSYQNTADIYLKNLDLSTGFGSYTYVLNKEIKLKNKTLEPFEMDIQLSSSGYSSVMNSLVAISLALLLGIEKDIIKKGIEDFTGVERRFEMIQTSPFKIIDDHFANSRNIEITMETLMKMDYKSLVMVYAIRGNRGVHLNEEVSQTMSKFLKKAKLKKFIASLSQDCVSQKDRVHDEERQIFLKVMEEEKIQVELMDQLEDALNQALEFVEDGDLLLLAGCQGMDHAGFLLTKNSNPRLNQEELSQRVQGRSC
ncbi:Mur ligase family protein [Urinicoccus timonensis]|uniref:Mur ligase family protein n=1 Tax=Urinicoccus timonensis TaxID=2024205 RepID=UPI001F430497|nr:UDP-N-acetylmuramyl-tripeptide synthetase [Urinicoccus timonensis]